MNRPIVHDDNVVRHQRRHEKLFNVINENITVHRSVDHQRGGNPIVPQRRDEGRGFPVAMWRFRYQALPFLRKRRAEATLRITPDP